MDNRKTGREIINGLRVPPEFLQTFNSDLKFYSADELLRVLEGLCEFEEVMNWNPIQRNKAVQDFIAEVSHLADLEGAQSMLNMEAVYACQGPDALKAYRELQAQRYDSLEKKLMTENQRPNPQLADLLVNLVQAAAGLVMIVLVMMLIVAPFAISISDYTL